MNGLIQFFRSIPWWACLIVLVVLSTAALYSFNRRLAPVTGESGRRVDDYYVIDFVDPSGPVGKVGVIAGDTIIHVNQFTIPEWFSRHHGQTARDTLIFGVIRSRNETSIPVIGASIFSNSPIYFWFINVLIAVCSIAGLFIIYKRPGDKASRLFFIYLQLFMVLMNGEILSIPKPTFLIASLIFIISSCQLGPTIIHFHMYFPKPVRLLGRYGHLPWLFHLAGFLISLIYSGALLHDTIGLYPDDNLYYVTERVALAWVTFCFCIAVGIVVYQFATNKDTLIRNQLRLVIIGSLFGLLTPIVLTFFYDQILPLQTIFPSLLSLLQGTGGTIMILCILIALFRYRIWNIEVIFRKALFYIAATLTIILSYFLLIWLIDRFILRENNLVRFLILGASVTIFLILRDRMQRLIDKIFYRETYDSATVVSNFELKLSGIYNPDILKQQIVQGLDEIFHFRSIVFGLHKKELIFEPASAQGMNRGLIPEFEITPEFEEKLRNLNVFSLQELEAKPTFIEATDYEIVVPLVSDNRPTGFFLCGPKKSEHIYSQQDIRILKLLAQRVIAFLHTAGLYQKDLDRQLMLERERARISQDMHDDIGAGLTKIAMMSEAPMKTADQEKETRDRLSKVASGSREMISSLNVIVWALNPKYDNLDNLVTYLRRYIGEYLESFGIRFASDVPEMIPEFSLTPDTRRNIFYAVKEAVHNAVKHGECTEINLSITVGQQKIEIGVTDNGKGFELNKTRSLGNGLHNMKQRAEETGGTFRIETAPFGGTTIFFSFECGNNPGFENNINKKGD